MEPFNGNKTTLHIQEIRTEQLDSNRLRQSVPELTPLLLSWNQEIVNLTYGWGCHLPMDRLWQPIPTKTVGIQAFIERSEKDGIFGYGRCDLHIEDPQRVFEFLLCHESDIHFSSDNEHFVEQVLTLWRAKGLTLYVSPGPRGSAQPKDWKRVDQFMP